MGMKLATGLCNLHLEWIRFFSSWRDRSLMIGRSRKGYWRSRGRVPVVRGLVTGSCMSKRKAKQWTQWNQWHCEKDSLNQKVRQCYWDIHEIENDDVACSSTLKDTWNRQVGSHVWSWYSWSQGLRKLHKESKKPNPQREGRTKKTKMKQKAQGLFNPSHGSMLRLGRDFMAAHAHDIRLKVRRKMSDVIWK